MNIQFRKLHLPSLPEVNARALVKLAGDSENSGLRSPSLPAGVLNSQIVSRSNLDEIIQDIENNRSENITPLEWLHCIYNKDKWDANNLERSRSTSEAIWKAAEQNSWLKQKLFWNLVLNYDNKKTLALSLIESYSVFLPQNSRDKKILFIIKFFNINYSAVKITQISLAERLTPDELFSQCQLPSKNSMVEKCLSSVVYVFSKVTHLNDELIEWLLRCFEKMNERQQVAAVEELLLKIDSKVGSQYSQLMSWLRKNYGFSVPNSRWNKLSAEAKAAMRRWIGAVSYQDFQQLVNLVLNRVYLPEHEHRRLKSRSGFWSNYSDRFERIRILLPQSSVSILGSYLNHKDVEILQEDGSDPTEVCIFDFGNWFVVEFFRGNGSETRIFTKNSETEQQLFNSQLSIKKLRCLGLNNPIHDHVMCWQYFCERWLKEKNILPNQNTTYFKGVPPRYSKYSIERGLPKPSPENIIQRDRQLNRWRQNIALLEQDARGYC